MIDRRLATLAFANFIVGTGTFIVAGLLNQLAEDLGVSLAAAGQLLSGYAIAICFGAPILAALTARIDRRALLAATLALYALLHIAAAAAPGYRSLAVLRFVTGLCAAVISPQATSTADLLVLPEARARALGAVFLGFSVSTVVGVPLGTYLGALLGWRLAFWLTGALALTGTVVTWMALPPRLVRVPMDARAWRELAGNGVILAMVATTVVQATGQFVLFSYLAPVVNELVGAGPEGVSLVFMWFGVCGVIGNIVAAPTIDRLGPARVVTAALAAMLTAFLLWPLGHGSAGLLALTILIWGLGCFAINMAQQTQLIATAPRLASASIALNSSAIFLGQALGASLGGLVIVAHGLGALSWVGAAILMAAVGVSIAADRALASALARARA